MFSYVNSLFLAISKRAFSKVTIVFGQSMQWLQLRQIDREINRKKNNFRAYARRLIEDKVKAIQSGEDKKGGNF